MPLGVLVSRNVKALRLKAGLSQQQLADRTKLTVRYISRLENTAPNITLDVLERLARGLECSACQIVREIKAKPASKKTTETINQAIRLLQSLRSRIE